jgi:C1A family cysteine protease
MAEGRGVVATNPAVSFRDAQTPVRDQGPRPTCAAFAVTAAHEWMRGDGADLSEESCLWSADTLGGPNGGSTSVQLGLEGISADGQAFERHWPYGNPAWPAPPPTSAADRTNRVGPGDWRALGRATFAEIRKALDQRAAVICSLRFVPFAWYGVADDAVVDAPPGEITTDGHAVLAIGIRPWGAGEVIEIKNSWGDGWGDSGYGYLADTYWTRYGKAAFALAAQ